MLNCIINVNFVYRYISINDSNLSMRCCRVCSIFLMFFFSFTFYIWNLILINSSLAFCCCNERSTNGVWLQVEYKKRNSITFVFFCFFLNIFILSIFVSMYFFLTQFIFIVSLFFSLAFVIF